MHRLPRSPKPSRRRPSRRGFTLLELMVTVVLIGAATAAALPLLVMSASTRRDAVQRQVAVIEASNVLELATTAPYDAVTAPALEELTSKVTPSALPGAEWTVRVEPEEGTPPGKQIAVELSWSGRDGERAAPVRLSAWMYRPDGETP